MQQIRMRQIMFADISKNLNTSHTTLVSEYQHMAKTFHLSTYVIPLTVDEPKVCTKLQSLHRSKRTSLVVDR